jgi:hypothetical protein
MVSIEENLNPNQVHFNKILHHDLWPNFFSSIQKLTLLYSYQLVACWPPSALPDSTGLPPPHPSPPSRTGTAQRGRESPARHAWPPHPGLGAPANKYYGHAKVSDAC